MDYRAEYFAHNPGLFGCIWTCAYCHRPLVGKHNVVVDHIVPLNSPLGRNARYNLVAACQSCNARKSDKIDARIVGGYVSKGFEVIIFTVQKVFLIALVGLWTAALWCFKGLKSILLLPFDRTSIKTKLAAAVLYLALLYLAYRLLFL